MLSSIDGAIGPVAEARIPVAHDGLLRGDGVFEVMRLYQGVPFALEDHYARLARTCAGLRLDRATRGRPPRDRPVRRNDRLL